MIQIANVPYQRVYKFPYLSDAMLLKAVLYSISLILPFFLVFSTNNFYLSHTTSTPTPKLTYTYSYHLTIQTETSLYTYSTLYRQTPLRSISFSYENNDNLLTHTFTGNWMKPVGERVRRVGLAVVMGFSVGGVQGVGVVYGEGTGYDIADVNIVGSVGVATGMNAAQNPPTTNILPQYNYNIGATILALQKNYKTYLKFTSQYLTNNMPNNLLKFSLKLKAPTIAVLEENASVLGQLVWSFTQYFPIAVVFWLVSTVVLRFVLRENIVRRAVIHDRF